MNLASTRLNAFWPHRIAQSYASVPGRRSTDPSRMSMPLCQVLILTRALSVSGCKGADYLRHMSRLPLLSALFTWCNLRFSALHVSTPQICMSSNPRPSAPIRQPTVYVPGRAICRCWQAFLRIFQAQHLVVSPRIVIPCFLVYQVSRHCDRQLYARCVSFGGQCTRHKTYRRSSLLRRMQACMHSHPVVLTRCSVRTASRVSPSHEYAFARKEAMERFPSSEFSPPVESV